MRNIFVILFVTGLSFVFGWFYYWNQNTCQVPIRYSIGEINDAFGLSYNDLRDVLLDAELVWEDKAGQNLFTYDASSKFTINLIYDERQKLIDSGKRFRNKLDKTQGASESLHNIHQNLVIQYSNLVNLHDETMKDYEEKLDSHNAQVQSYNQAGGVTKEQYEILQTQKKELEMKKNDLNKLSENLNVLVAKINDTGDRGNILIDMYNRGVHEYNDSFGKSREFTQGTYSSGTRINIYTFYNKDDLRLVLAHELGHALSLGHVKNTESIMYFLIGDQPRDFSPTPEDMYEFNRVCDKKGWNDIVSALIIN